MPPDAKLTPSALASAQTLLKELAHGDALVVVGSGVSLTATHGAPVASWTGLIEDGIQTAEAQRPDLPAGWASRAREELEGGSLDELLIVAEKVARALGPPTGGTWRHWLRKTVGSLRAIDPRVPLALGNLGVPLATTNYDDILSETTGARPVTWQQPHKVLEALRRERVGVVHLHGHWDESESVVLGIRSYDELLNRPEAQAIQQAIALLRRLVFVGCGTGLSDPNMGELLRWLGANFSSSGHMHMRLVTEGEVAAARQQHAPSVVEPIVYGEKFTDLEPFLAYVAAERIRLAPTAADDIQAALQHPDAAERERLVGDFARSWRSADRERALAAHDGLKRLAADESTRVAALARSVLDSESLDPPKAAASATARAPAAVDPQVARDELDDGGVAADARLLTAVRSAMVAAQTLVAAYRTHGHLAARLDPLGSEPQGDPALDPEPLGLTRAIMESIPADVLRISVPGNSLMDALPHLQETYCGTMAYEIEHIASHRQRVWLREKIETGAFRKPLTGDEKVNLLRRLTQVDAFDRFLRRTYTGQQQFSIEGLDMTVPMLDELIQLAGANGAREVMLGMAHRGRLNVLAHNLGRPYETIFSEFEGASSLRTVTTIPEGGTGDVKYHHGAQGTYQIGDSSSAIIVRLESNPDHLEFVAPVVAGAARAAQTSRLGPRAHLDTIAAIPIILHGDAALPGQGVVAETFNLQALDGYTVGGTLHIIQNNQVGFTTDPDDSRSTRWASDIAKGFDVPIIHVNADDVEACISAARLAFAFRQEFGHDVMIDLIGYRRFGHDETDEPAYTQPEAVAQIEKTSGVSERFTERLVADNVVTRSEALEMRETIWSELVQRHHWLKAELSAEPDEQPTGGYELDRSPSREVKTAVDADTLHRLNQALLTVPDGFTIHPKLIKQLERRRDALGPDGGIDWAHAEALAFASLLAEGTPVRLTGHDCERGTFSQRHLVLHDAGTGMRVSPIQSLPDAHAPMELHNSPVSEAACLGFEYGYSMEAPEMLVLWEAQFGDFANAAQVIIDQFIVSALSKWGQSTRLTLLLPHGYEGSGPEHSSGRLERFLMLAAEGNIRVANLTTPAQYFHLLRLQALVAKQRPLVIMTPKSLLRLPQATSRIEHLSESRFFPVLSEPRIDVERITRLVLCSGKIFYDLKGQAVRIGAEDDVAISRVELLYPFPQLQILDEVARYPNLREVVWAQEEPRNMGARAHMVPRLQEFLPSELDLGYVGRPERASPAEGYPSAHVQEQVRIVHAAVDTSVAVSNVPSRPPGQR